MTLHAEPLDFDPEWTVGTSWQLIAEYRQINGGWSDPVTWDFKITAETGGCFLVSVTSDISAGGELSFDRSTGQLTRVVWQDRVKGEKLVREVNFEGPAPAYPHFSIIPFYTPVFSRGVSSSQSTTYHLRRQLGGRDLGAEELEQTVRPADAGEFLTALPDAAGKEWAGVNLSTNGFRVVVKKRGARVFEQFWFPGFPWALYTETGNHKVWLAR